MRDTIKLYSRDGINNYLKLVKSDSNTIGTYLLVPEYDSLLVMSDGDIINYIDPPGGPAISIGNTVWDNYYGYKVLGIEFDNGYLIKLEEIN